MAKTVVAQDEFSKNAKGCSLDQIQKWLSENNACYVLITCKEPTADGKMNVEMVYDGDEVLASYLVDNAQQIFDNRARSEKSH